MHGIRRQKNTHSFTQDEVCSSLWNDTNGLRSFLEITSLRIRLLSPAVLQPTSTQDGGNGIDSRPTRSEHYGIKKIEISARCKKSIFIVFICRVAQICFFATLFPVGRKLGRFWEAENYTRHLHLVFILKLLGNIIQRDPVYTNSEHSEQQNAYYSFTFDSDYLNSL